ncbi:hypothetical protein F2P81_010554 [Scophthalmus maximus]|uniref:Uncharacterized protein n=1 Tax=Scophthalmus maximus TaxID=52904 RepID=A0A6A4T0X9_SCOMX|nr:hypothetical protein F2P81_010554 [Scophthalmus maximus]
MQPHKETNKPRQRMRLHNLESWRASQLLRSSTFHGFHLSPVRGGGLEEVGGEGVGAGGGGTGRTGGAGPAAFRRAQLPVTMAMQVFTAPVVSAFVSTALSLLSLTLLLLLCVIRKKRRMEGTYRPSAEERKQTGAAGSEKPGLTLPLPKEERLI